MRQGFSLIELCIVLIISGIMLSGLLALWQVHAIQAKEHKNKLKMDQILLALSQYVQDEPGIQDEVRFPCPAPLNARPAEQRYGLEFCGSKELQTSKNFLSLTNDLGGVFVLRGAERSDTKNSDAREIVLIGALPGKTLGLPDDMMVDAYGNRFFYAITYNLSKPNALLQEPQPEGAIPIINDQSHDIMRARFVVFSAGHDGAGAYTKEGVQGVPCRKDYRNLIGIKKTTGLNGDLRNCAWQNDQMAIFRAQNFMSHGHNTQYYDDLLSFRMFAPEDQNGWWMATDETGRIIRNKNVDRVEIGQHSDSADPDDMLVVGGKIRTTGDMTIAGNLDIGARIKTNEDMDIQGNLKVGHKYKNKQEEQDEDEDPVARLDVAGGIKIGQQVEKDLDCKNKTTGMIRLKTQMLEYCDGQKWRLLLLSGFKCKEPGTFMTGIKLNGQIECAAPPPPGP